MSTLAHTTHFGTDLCSNTFKSKLANIAFPHVMQAGTIHWDLVLATATSCWSLSNQLILLPLLHSHYNLAYLHTVTTFHYLSFPHSCTVLSTLTQLLVQFKKQGSSGEIQCERFKRTWALSVIGLTCQKNVLVCVWMRFSFSTLHQLWLFRKI